MLLVLNISECLLGIHRCFIIKVSSELQKLSLTQPNIFKCIWKYAIMMKNRMQVFLQKHLNGALEAGYLQRNLYCLLMSEIFHTTYL